jgi:DNA-directed RNA polymerase specialized sigma24 family protein
MGSTGDPSGGSSLAPCGPVASPRNRGAGRKGVPAAREDIWGSLPELYHKQYRSLFRLAVLLTGDPDAAEAVVVDCFAAWCRLRKRPQAEDGALPYLRRQLVARSRRARHHHLWDGSRRPRREGTGPPGCTGTPHQAPRPETPAVTLALRRLPTGQREAIVLTFYLDLSAEQAAAAMRVSPATLRRHLAKATSALRAALPANPQVPPVPPPTASAISQPPPCGTPPDQFTRAGGHSCGVTSGKPARLKPGQLHNRATHSDPARIRVTCALRPSRVWPLAGPAGSGQAPGLPGRLALPATVLRAVCVFVPCATSNIIDNRRLRAPRRAVETGLLLTLRS